LQEPNPQTTEHRADAHLGTTFSQVPPENARLTDRDSARLAGFVDNDFAAVRNIVSSLCGRQSDADAAVAEALARAVEQLGRGRTIDVLNAWITRVAINVGRSELRKVEVRRRRASEAAPPVHAETVIDSVAARLDLQAALRSLTRRQAEVVALYYGLDLSVTDVAQVLDRSEGTIKTTLSKARTKLALTLGSTTENEEDHGTA
jgi:RNA polymerase sigma-70 factor, ECF subfamily